MWERIKGWFSPEFEPLKISNFKLFNSLGEVIFEMAVDYKNPEYSKIVINKLD